MADAQTLNDLIDAGADDATALSAPGGKPLTFRELRALVAGRSASSMATASAAVTAWPSCCRTDRKWPPLSSRSPPAPRPRR